MSEYGTGLPEGGESFRAEVRDALAELSVRLDREHERAAHREAVIDRLHAENQRLRRGELQAMLEPVRAALYRLHDQARRESERLVTPGLDGPPDPALAAGLLAAVADDVADALARIGVERFTVRPGEPYDAARHRPVAVEHVADPGLDGTVVSVHADGFEVDGRVVRKAAVRVAKRGGNGGAGGTASGTGGRDTAEHPEAGGPAVRAGSSRLRAAGRGETMNTGLGTDG